MSSAQQQPQQYKCSTCSQKFDKPGYFDHMLCKESVQGVIEKVFSDSRKENIMLREKITEIGIQTDQLSKQKDAQIETLRTKCERMQEEIRNIRKECDSHQAQTRAAGQRVEDKNNEILRLQRENVKLKVDSEAEINRIQSKHLFDIDSLNSSWKVKIERVKMDGETARLQFDEKLTQVHQSWEDRVRDDKKDLE